MKRLPHLSTGRPKAEGLFRSSTIRLFHIDDDELLHLEVPFAQLVQEAGPAVTCIVLQNVEAIPQKLAVECIFADIDLFCLDIHSLLAYANGKSAGRCGFCTWLGPHRFTGRSIIVDADQAALLHFESCTYEMWRNKFSKHRHMEERKKVDIDKIPFPFYRDSIRLFQKDQTGGKNEERWKAFFVSCPAAWNPELAEKHLLLTRSGRMPDRWSAKSTTLTRCRQPTSSA